MNHMAEYSEEVADRKINLENWQDGDKWDMAGKFTDSDFIPETNNIYFEKSIQFEKHLKDQYNYLINERRELDSQLHEYYGKSAGIG